MFLRTTHTAMSVIWLTPKNEINNREMKKKSVHFLELAKWHSCCMISSQEHNIIKQIPKPNCDS